jgi:folylpolyglutamate synthase/dihydropteroate synthase
MYALGHELAQTPSHKFDLAHMRVLLAALGHPENRFPTVLVAGTNGKGSTAATLASILQASGLKDGALYFAASGSHQRAYSPQWQTDRRRRFRRAP